jgi:hypothetical protein
VASLPLSRVVAVAAATRNKLSAPATGALFVAAPFFVEKGGTRELAR